MVVRTIRAHRARVLPERAPKHFQPLRANPASAVGVGERRDPAVAPPVCPDEIERRRGKSRCSADEVH